MDTLEKVLEILHDIDPEIDYRTEKGLVDKQLVNSFFLITLIGELEDAFDIKITTAEVVPSNMNSAEAITAMVERLKK